MNYMNISINKWIVFAVIIFLLLALTAFAGYCVYDLYQVFSVESEVNGKPDDVSIEVYIPPLLELRGEGDTLLSSDIDYMYFENDVLEYKTVQRYKDIYLSEIDLSKVTYENFDSYKDRKVYITNNDFFLNRFVTVADVIYFEAVEDTRYYAKYEFEPMSYDSAKDYYLKFNNFFIFLESENYYLSGNINFEFTLPNNQNNLQFTLEVNISIFSNKTVVEFAYDTKDYASDNVKFFNNYLVNEGIHIEVLSYDKISDIPLTSHETGTNVEVVEPAPEQPEEPDGGDEVVEPEEPGEGEITDPEEGEGVPEVDYSDLDYLSLNEVKNNTCVVSFSIEENSVYRLWFNHEYFSICGAMTDDLNADCGANAYMEYNEGDIPYREFINQDCGSGYDDFANTGYFEFQNTSSLDYVVFEILIFDFSNVDISDMDDLFLKDYVRLEKVN